MGSDDSERDDVPQQDVPVTPPPPPEEQDAVPTITGLFDAPDVDEPAEPEPVFTDPPQPDTDSVRILAEMFQGFRRRSANPQHELQQILGTATQSVATIDPPTGSEPPTTAGQIPIIPVDDGTDDENDAEDVDDASNDEALAWLPAPTTTAEETYVAPEDAPQTVKTAYVPRDGGNQTEQALAWLTAENVPTGQTPVIAAPALVPRRRHRWVAAVFAPIFTAIALAVVYVVAFAVWPLSNVAPTIAEAEYSTPVAPAADLPWPETGQGAILVDGAGDVVTSATDEAPTVRGPMASLTKVITVLVLLDQQPLEPGADGPSYDFGYLDQQQAQTLRWLNNESALDVPIGGTLTYRQLLEGILMGSAGNFANKLVDELWEGDRDAYVDDALAWLQDNGFFDTLIVDATGISPDNQSTPEDLVKIAELAMQNPTIAEIVAQDEVDMPGAGEVENSNPLLGEDGIAGIKTGHLDEWNVVSYNLMTAKDIESDDDEADPIRVYSVVMGQPTPTEERPYGAESREVLDAVTERLQPVDAMAEQTILGTVTTPWGGRADIVADDTASLILWNGEEADVDIDFTVKTGDTEGKTVGSVTITSALDSTEVELVMTDDLPRPSIGWRLTHPLELLGFGA